MKPKILKQEKSYQTHTFLIDLSMCASGPGKGLLTAKEPRSSITVFCKRKMDEKGQITNRTD